MPHVWRLETNRSHRGIYTVVNQDEIHDDIGFKFNPAQHPCPNTDDGLRSFWQNLPIIERWIWFFGFGTLEQYLEWFSEPAVRKVLANLEIKAKDSDVDQSPERFVLRRYLVPEGCFFLGEKQAVFIRESAVSVEERSPDYADQEGEIDRPDRFPTANPE